MFWQCFDCYCFHVISANTAIIVAHQRAYRHCTVLLLCEMSIWHTKAGMFVKFDLSKQALPAITHIACFDPVHGIIKTVRIAIPHASRAAYTAHVKCACQQPCWCGFVQSFITQPLPSACWIQSFQYFIRRLDVLRQHTSWDPARAPLPGQSTTVHNQSFSFSLLNSAGEPGEAALRIACSFLSRLQT